MKIFSLAKTAATFEGTLQKKIPGDMFDRPASQIGNIPIRPFVEKFVAPRLSEMGVPGAEGYTYDIFGNLSRLETGLDKRRQNDSFYEYGPRIKKLRDEAVKAYAKGGTHPEFQSRLDDLVHSLYDYYVNHAPKQGIVKRKRSWEIPSSNPQPQYTPSTPRPPQPKKPTPEENYRKFAPLRPAAQKDNKSTLIR